MISPVAVISDIHANYTALRSVLDDIHSRGIQRIWCLGDIVGRGPDPVEVVRALRNIYYEQQPRDQAGWLLGNHDLLVLGRIDIIYAMGRNFTEYNEQTLNVALTHRPILEAKGPYWDWLSQFEYSYNYIEHGIYLAHAALRFTENGDVVDKDTYGCYMWLDADIEPMIQQLRYHQPKGLPRIMLGGHTHVSGLWQWDSLRERAIKQPHKIDEPMILEHLSENPVYANPGSVGYPRKSDAKSTYCVLTEIERPDAIQIEYHQVT